MELQAAISSFKAHQLKTKAYNHAMGMLFYDAETCMPKGAGENLGKTLGILSEEVYKLETSQELSELLKVLSEHKSELDRQTAREVEEISRSLEKMEKIPMQEFVDYQVLTNKSQQIWQQAKGESNYALFSPYLEKLIDAKRRFAKYVRPDEQNIYNTMLDDYERGLTTEVLDEYFKKLRTALVPLIAKIGQAASPRTDFLSRNFPIDKQRELSNYLMDVLCMDRNHCAIAETEHPFTTEFSKFDVRITTHYYTDSIASSFYSVVHEGGHGLYELNIGDDLTDSVLANGTSMGIHESQSRFWENVVGRSEQFCNFVFPKIKELFPEQMQDVTAHEFYLAVNEAKPSLIRIEADELTYSMHIMVRYEIEKRIMSGELSVADLPTVWNQLYKEYLGVDVPDDEHGLLQDVHWAGGMFGYFPSYSIGSAYAAQITESMKKDLDLDGLISKGDTAPVIAWLTERIYKHGTVLTPPEVIENCCGAPFDADFYINYLTEKYSKIYNLK